MKVFNPTVLQVGGDPPSALLWLEHLSRDEAMALGGELYKGARIVMVDVGRTVDAEHPDAINAAQVSLRERWSQLSPEMHERVLDALRSRARGFESQGEIGRERGDQDSAEWLTAGALIREVVNHWSAWLATRCV